MPYAFRWNESNVDHIGKHAVEPAEAEYVVNHPGPGSPKKLGDGKYSSIGQTAAGRYLQVIYIFDPPFVVYVIHARPLDESEKRRLRRRGRRRGR